MGTYDRKPLGQFGKPPEFAADAWRVARNWALDYSWYSRLDGGDASAIELSNRLLSFFAANVSAGGGGGVGKYSSKFDLSGSSSSKDHSTGLVGMNAVAVLASDEASSWDFVDELWNTEIPTGRWRYYNGMLYLEAMLVCSGQYRAWSASSATSFV